MNPPEDSIEILISTVYQRNLSSDETIRYEQLMEGPLGLFLGIEGTTERTPIDGHFENEEDFRNRHN